MLLNSFYQSIGKHPSITLSNPIFPHTQVQAQVSLMHTPYGIPSVVPHNRYVIRILKELDVEYDAEHQLHPLSFHLLFVLQKK